MALKKKTGSYDIHAYGEDTNPSGKPTLSWQNIGACGPSAERDWTSDTSDQFADNIGIGMAELIYNRVHPLISPGIDSMDDDLPSWEEAGDGGVPKYDENGELNPNYPGGMTADEYQEMQDGAISDQINAKRFWLDLSYAISQGVIDHIKLDPNIAENINCGLETKQAANTILEVRDEMITILGKLEEMCDVIGNAGQRSKANAVASGLMVPAQGDYIDLIYEILFAAASIITTPPGNPTQLANLIQSAGTTITNYETALGVHTSSMVTIASNADDVTDDAASVKDSLQEIKNSLNSISYNEADGTE